MASNKFFSKKALFFELIIFFIIIQIFGIDKGNPLVDQNKNFITVENPPAEIAGILKTSCYDCHSFETVYPWYTNIAPVSWWIKHHINEGREELNFSLWGDYPEKRANHKLEEMYEQIEEDEMPLTSYTIIHSGAALSYEQRQAFTKWLRSSGRFELEEEESNE